MRDEQLYKDKKYICRLYIKNLDEFEQYIQDLCSQNKSISLEEAVKFLQFGVESIVME